MDAHLKDYVLTLINDIKSGKYNTVVDLLKIHFPLQFQDELGKTALISVMESYRLTNEQKNSLIDMILDEEQLSNDILSLKDKFGKTALSIAVENRDYELMRKILKKIKYNAFKSLTEEIQKCESDIVSEELSNMALSFDMTSAINRLSVTESPLKILKNKLEIDRNFLDNGINWPAGKVCLDVSMKLADKNRDEIALNLLEKPPVEPVVLKVASYMKRVFKRPTPKSRTPVKASPSTTFAQTIIDARRLEQQNKREMLLSARRTEGEKKADGKRKTSVKSRKRRSYRKKKSKSVKRKKSKSPKRRRR